MAGATVIRQRDLRQKSKPKLLAIDGYYQTAEDISAMLRNRRPSMARRRDHENHTAQLTAKEQQWPRYWS